MNKEKQKKFFMCNECGGSGEIFYTYGWGINSSYGPEQDVKCCNKCIGTGKTGILKYIYHYSFVIRSKIGWFKYNLSHKRKEKLEEEIELPF